MEDTASARETVIAVRGVPSVLRGVGATEEESLPTPLVSAAPPRSSSACPGPQPRLHLARPPEPRSRVRPTGASLPGVLGQTRLIQTRGEDSKPSTQTQKVSGRNVREDPSVCGRQRHDANRRKRTRTRTQIVGSGPQLRGCLAPGCFQESLSLCVCACVRQIHTCACV